MGIQPFPANTLLDGAAYVSGGTRVTPAGFKRSDTGNVGPAVVDQKNALVAVIEDPTTAGRKLKVNADGSVNILKLAPADVTLLSGASSTGSGVVIIAGDYLWYCYGTFGGCTAQLQFSPDSGTTWINIDNASFIANGGAKVSLPVGQARVLITGGSGVNLSSKLGGLV